MKLNKTRLKQLIQEELQAALSEETDAEKLDKTMRDLVAQVVKSMNSYGNIVSIMADLIGTYRTEPDAKLQEITGVTKQDLEKVMLLNKKIENELSPIYTQMRRQVAANQAGVTPSPYGMTEK